MRGAYGLLAIALWAGCGSTRGGRSAESAAAPPAAVGKALVWSDEFDADGLPDPTRWTYDVGGGGWGNNELQYYTEAKAQNARVADGVLVVEAHRAPTGARDYSSARLVTRGLASWDHGYIEARAKLPSGVGTWPAIWMLGDNLGEVGWPRAGEIDIMEHVGYAPDSIFGTVHTAAFNHVAGTEVGKTVVVPGAEGQFHTYAIDWDAERIEWLVDGEVYHRFDKRAGAGVAEWPFDAPQYLLLNLAVGGQLGRQARRGYDGLAAAHGSGLRTRVAVSPSPRAPAAPPR